MTPVVAPHPSYSAHYRPEIDGLRAVAVIAILAFHAGLQLPGGFLGVDVFFVISGYLITSIIQREVLERRFSLIGFYHRRVIRILPALLIMMSSSCLLGALLLLPSEIKQLTQSAASAAAFGSNIFFWREAAYFGGMSELRPLLHTWSLSVEEQFYLVYPIILLFTLKRINTKYIFYLFIIVVIISLSFSLLYRYSNPVPIFYLLPGRIWQLGLGAIVAIGSEIKSSKSINKNCKYNIILGWIGLIITLAALCFADENDAQGIWAIVASLGAAMIIAFANENGVGKLLDTAPLRIIGLMSYSIYIWHWPILAFYRTVYGNTLNIIETFGLISASFILAFISFRYVEQPFRVRYRREYSVRVVATGVAASAVIICTTLLLGKFANTVRDLPPEVQRIAAFSDYWKWPRAKYTPEQYCTSDRASGAPQIYCSEGDVLVAGDSHANHIVDALRLRFPKNRIVPVITRGCHSLIGDPPSACTHRFDEALKSFVVTGKVQAVVLAARWRDDDIALGRLVKTINVLRSYGVRVTIIGPVVEYDGDFPRIVARAMLSKDFARVDDLRRRSREKLDRRMAMTVRATEAQYFSAYNAECPKGICRIFSSKNEPMHFDYGHFTRSGSEDIIAGLSRP